MKYPKLALESTVIAHGLPYPQNLETARALEAIAREHGVEPLTIAILGGEIRIGLNDGELQHLAQVQNALKISRRDIPIAIAHHRDGATTVSATMWLAHRAGIHVFATGGIGGVHRGNPQDISADLMELASTPVVVVCAGAKAILDLAATLEFLETHNVPVLGFQTAEFPAFYSRSSGLRVQARIDSAEDVARLVKTHWDLGLRSGVLVCVPIPNSDQITRESIEPDIQQALDEAHAQGVIGSAVTPFLLHRLETLTHGTSVQANIALLKNNVTVAADIAEAISHLDITTV